MNWLKYRSADYLSSRVAPLFSGSFTINRTIHAPPDSRSQTNAPITSAAGRVDQSSDTMVFMGSAKEIELLKKVLPQVDLRQGEVSIRAWVYEVSSGNDRSSGFSIALNVLNSRLVDWLRHYRSQRERIEVEFWEPRCCHCGTRFGLPVSGCHFAKHARILGETWAHERRSIGTCDFFSVVP